MPECLLSFGLVKSFEDHLFPPCQLTFVSQPGSKDSIEDVLENLVQGLSGQWIRLSQRWKKPSKSSISEARQQVGPQVMSQLFRVVARPLGTEQTPGAFLNGLRLMAVDGTSFDLPDTAENARVFGYPGTRGGTEASFPKARLVKRSRSWNPFNHGRIPKPLPHGREKQSFKGTAFCGNRHVTDVG